jgi:uncharacterized membrane protein YeaQ/YmgE (transglycosylase-associated protein family)
MHGSLEVLRTQYGGFLALIVIGGLAGWIAGMILRVRHSIFTNIIVGVAGSWIGSEIADLAHFAVRHTFGHFVAALVGSVVLLYIWQWIDKRA